MNIAISFRLKLLEALKNYSGESRIVVRATHHYSGTATATRTTETESPGHETGHKENHSWQRGSMNL